MDPINPWLDPVEVRRLAERLMVPFSEPRLAKPDAGFDEAFVGYAGQGSAPAVPSPFQPQQLQPAPPPAPVELQPSVPTIDASSQISAEDLLTEPRQTTARGPFLDRIIRFRDWLSHRFSATGIFILDREGSVIFDESGHGRLHFLARSLALSSRRPGAPPGNVHVKVGSDTILEVIPVETPYGCLVVGAVVTESIPPAAVQEIMRALTEVASPPAATVV